MDDEAAGPSRVEVATALFDRLKTAGEFRTTQNGRVPSPGEVTGIQQPALFLGLPDEQVDYAGPGGLLRRRTMTFMVALFAQGGGLNDDTAALEILALVDGLDRVLKPDLFEDGTDEACTLGRLVIRTRIEGEVTTNEYRSGESQALAFVPITVLLP